jgi:hypothetical protein
VTPYGTRGAKSEAGENPNNRNDRQKIESIQQQWNPRMQLQTEANLGMSVLTM